MARPLRLEFAGALSHNTSRGNHREDIYDRIFDNELFYPLLIRSAKSAIGFIIHIA